MGSQAKSTLDGLPRQFVASLRTLFDILDDDKTGYVKFTDIEARWKDEGVHGLPHGVLESLRKVTPKSGFITFERFVAGLKIALLRTRPDVKARNPTGNENQVVGVAGPKVQHPSQNGTHGHGPPPPVPPQRTHGPTTAKVRPNNAMTQHRAYSLSQLGDRGVSHAPQDTESAPPLPPPPVHMRSGSNSENYPPAFPQREVKSTSSLPDHAKPSKNGIVDRLRNWQRERMGPGSSAAERDPRRPDDRRSSGDGKANFDREFRKY